MSDPLSRGVLIAGPLMAVDGKSSPVDGATIQKAPCGSSIGSRECCFAEVKRCNAIMEFVLGLLAMVAEMMWHIVIGLAELLLGLIAAIGQRRATHDEQ